MLINIVQALVAVAPYLARLYAIIIIMLAMSLYYDQPRWYEAFGIDMIGRDWEIGGVNAHMAFPLTMLFLSLAYAVLKWIWALMLEGLQEIGCFVLDLILGWAGVFGYEHPQFCRDRGYAAAESVVDDVTGAVGDAYDDASDWVSTAYEDTTDFFGLGGGARLGSGPGCARARIMAGIL